jgi:hypothetical protein
MTDDSWNPVIIDLAAWVSGPPPAADPRAYGRLELRDARLTEVRALLCRAEDLIHDLLSRHRPASNAPSVATELNLIAVALAALPEQFEGSQQNPDLLRRAAIMSVGQEWARLGGLLPSLRLRVSFVAQALAETAVGLARLRRSGPHLSVAKDPTILELEADEALVDEELRRRTAQAGADSAYAAADAAFLPSLSDFLR